MRLQNIRLGVMLPLTGAKLCIRHFQVRWLVERRAITGHSVRDLLLYWPPAARPGTSTSSVGSRSVLSLRSVALDGSQSGVKRSYHLRLFTNC